MITTLPYIAAAFAAYRTWGADERWPLIAVGVACLLYAWTNSAVRNAVQMQADGTGIPEATRFAALCSIGMAIITTGISLYAIFIH